VQITLTKLAIQIHSSQLSWMGPSNAVYHAHSLANTSVKTSFIIYAVTGQLQSRDPAH